MFLFSPIFIPNPVPLPVRALNDAGKSWNNRTTQDISIQLNVCVFYTSLHFPQPLFGECSWFVLLDIVEVFSLLICTYWTRFVVHILLLKEVTCGGFHHHTDCLSNGAARGFLIVLNPEWTINDVFLTEPELKFVWAFLSPIFLFKRIPMDCVMIWFMQLCWNEKVCVCNCFVMSLT